MWKNIWRGWGKFYAQVRFDMGDGSIIRFWHDVWCGDGDVALKEVHSVACAKEASVALNWGFRVSFLTCYNPLE